VVAAAEAANAARVAAEALERARARRAGVDPGPVLGQPSNPLQLSATIARAQAQRAQDASAGARQAREQHARAQEVAEERLARRRAAQERVARAQQELAELTLAELPEGEADPDAPVRAGLQDLFAGRSCRSRTGQHAQRSSPGWLEATVQGGVKGGFSTTGGFCRCPDGRRRKGARGVSWYATGTRAQPRGYAKVQQAPRFKGQTYSAYITWEVQFRALGQDAEALGHLPRAGGTSCAGGLHTRAAESARWSHAGVHFQPGVGVRGAGAGTGLDEHVQLVLEFKGDSETPPSPHEAWMMIRSPFMRELPTSKIQLTKQLGQLKLKEGEGIMAFWNRATNLRARYSAVHGKIEPEEWMGRILSALPDTWENITSIQSQLLPILD